MVSQTQYSGSTDDTCARAMQAQPSKLAMNDFKIVILMNLLTKYNVLVTKLPW